MTITKAALAAIALSSMTAMPAAAETVEVVSGSGQRSVVIPFFGTLGQSFTAVDTELTSFGFQFNALNPGNANDPFTFTLRAGEGLAGTVLATRTFSLPTSIDSRAPTWFDFDLTGTLVTVGQLYSAVLSTSNTRNGIVLGPDINIFTGVPLGGDAYAGGRALFTRSPYANCTSTPDCDLNFRVSGVSATAIPEPAMWGLMLIGFGSIGAAMRGRRKHRRSLA